MKDTIPKAWNKLVTGPDEALIELIAETTEKLCGYKPDHGMVEDFLVSQIPVLVPKQLPASHKMIKSAENRFEEEGYTGKSISAFTFKGTRYEVRTWKELLIRICNIMVTTHRDRFEQILTLAGRKRPYFTRNPNELRIPERVDGTDIYAETNLSASSIVKLSRDVLSLFGYSKEDLLIEVR